MKKFLSILCFALMIQITIPAVSFAHGNNHHPHNSAIRASAYRIPAPPHHKHYHPTPISRGISFVYAGHNPNFYYNYYPIGYYPTYYNYPAPIYYSSPMSYIRINF